MEETELRSQFSALSALLRDAALTATTPDDALTLSRIYGRLQWDNTSGLFADEALERGLTDRWGAHFSGFAETEHTGKIDILHVVTQIYPQGGHSRLLRKLMDGLGDGCTQAIVTVDQKKPKGNIIYGLPVTRLAGAPFRRLRELCRLGASAQTIILYIHPDDAISALAARLLHDAGRRVLFVNHADHVFSFGAGAASCVLEISATGWATTRDLRRARQQSFLGIPIIDGPELAHAVPAPRSGPILSVGGSGKFIPAGGMDFPAFAVRVLQRVPNDIVMVGPSEKDKWWRDALSAFPGRLQLRGPLPVGEVADLVAKASAYVDSFPLDGGTAYPQMAAAGLPCFGPNAQAALGISPADRLRLDTVSNVEEALVDYLKGGQYPFDLTAVRQNVATGFSSGIVAERCLRARDGQLIDLPDDLRNLGQRDATYYAKRWAEHGKMSVPSRIWSDLSWTARIRLLRKLPGLTLPAKARTKIRNELWLRWA